jgi:Family of unknown function (DUF6502)
LTVKGPKPPSKRIRRGGARSGQPLAFDDLQQLREILSNLVSVLIMSGYSSVDLAPEFAAMCRQLSARRATRSVSRGFKFDHMHIISHWYRDPDYLDAVGKPRKLPFSGAEPSLTRLIARVLPATSPRVVLDSLLELGAIRKSGSRYEPTRLFVGISENSAHWAYWNKKALHSVLQNMVHNYGAGAGHIMHLARGAFNPRFPVSELPKFHARMQRQALRFLNDVDASMQRMEVSGWEEETTETGVLMFAFENPIRSGVGGASTTNSPPRKSSRTGAPD